MAHQITERANGYQEMAFVGATPWHGLGQELERDASIEQWKVAAGMDWKIESSPVHFKTSPDNVYAENAFEGQRVLFRSDSGMPLSVVSKRYHAVQPFEVLEFFRDLMTENGFRLHTAGTLFGGKRLWALAETGKFAEVGNGDGIGGFLLLSTSADRSLATTARFTTVRVVCNNTLSMATNTNAHMVSFTHMTKFNHEKVKATLGQQVESFGTFMQAANYLKSQRLTAMQAKEFVNKIMLSAAQQNSPEYAIERNKPIRKILDLFHGEAKGVELAGETRWGLLNAVTEYFDHHHPARTGSARLNNAWFGNGNTAKDAALELLLA